jgi:hypothetical protein
MNDRSRHRWRGKVPIALFATSAALAGGAQALAPAPVAALQVDGCSETASFAACEGKVGGGSDAGGGSDTAGSDGDHASEDGIGPGVVEDVWGELEPDGDYDDVNTDDIGSTDGGGGVEQGYREIFPPGLDPDQAREFLVNAYADFRARKLQRICVRLLSHIRTGTRRNGDGVDVQKERWRYNKNDCDQALSSAD